MGSFKDYLKKNLARDVGVEKKLRTHVFVLRPQYSHTQLDILDELETRMTNNDPPKDPFILGARVASYRFGTVHGKLYLRHAREWYDLKDGRLPNYSIVDLVSLVIGQCDNDEMYYWEAR